MESVHLVVDLAESGKRLDVFLAAHAPHVSRTHAAALARDGKVLVNGSSVRPAHRLAPGDRVDAQLDVPHALSADPEPIPLSVIYEDADMAVIDKPAGMVVHPAPGNDRGTLANALAARFPAATTVGDAGRPGIVHRLDKDTSGLIVVALSRAGMMSLQGQIGAREADRWYLALAGGHLSPSEGTVDAPIGRDPVHRSRMAVHGVAARPARTSYRALERLPGFDLVEAKLHTGRTHQIRVHMAALGHPIAGDALYNGAALRGLNRQFLHARTLQIRRPRDDRPMSFSSPLPGDLQAVLDALRAGK